MKPEHELIQQWLSKAAKDMRAGEHVLKAEPPFVEDACFHAQQAVEKSLKAFLIHRDIDFPWSHDIRQLLKLSARGDQAFEAWLGQADRFTEYAARLRYPGTEPSPTIEEARQALAHAHWIHVFVLDRLPAETHPIN